MATTTDNATDIRAYTTTRPWIKAQGPGRVLIARMDDLINEYAGCLSTGGDLGRAVRKLRQEWE
jgi:hypothetical protein